MSGNPPFSRLHSLRIMFRVLNDLPPTPEEHPDLGPSDTLWGLMRRCWNKTPTARPTMRNVRREVSLYGFSTFERVS